MSEKKQGKIEERKKEEKKQKRGRKEKKRREVRESGGRIRQCDEDKIPF